VVTKLTQAIPFGRIELPGLYLPAGVALFCLLHFSVWLWPAVLAAALVCSPGLNLWTGFDAVANTLEPVLSALFIRALVRGSERLRRSAGLIAVIVIGGLASPTFVGLLVAGWGRWVTRSFAGPLAEHCLLWASSDFNGVLYATPFLLAVTDPGFKASIRERRGERVLALFILSAVTFITFEGLPGSDFGISGIRISFLVFPILAWMAARFGTGFTCGGMLVLASIAIHQTLLRKGPFSGETDDIGVLWLHFFLAVIGVFALLLSSGMDEKRRTERRLRESQQTYRFLFRHNPHPMWVFDCETLRFLEVNDSAIEKYGYSRDEFLEMTIKDVRPPEDLPRLAEDVEKTKSEPRNRGIWRHRKKDGTLIDVEVTACGFEAQGRQQRLILANDITDRKRLETELRQAQKFEALGRLAGGVAHDFNNLMMIISYAEMLQQAQADPARVRRNVDRILQTTERAAALTQQLLAFSRNQMLTPKIIELNTVTREMLGLVKRLIGEGVELHFSPGRSVCPVKIDSNQFTQVVLNLCANARDAMNGKGRLTILTTTLETRGMHLHGDGRLPAGVYALLRVTDTGSGMSPEVKERMFEPFFTTKERGKGTGLGLSTVYGIVTQSGGYIGLTSTVGQGSEFTLYFPQADEAAAEAVARPAHVLEKGRESLLVVEDERELRSAVVESLRSLGYRVLHAGDGQQAIEMAEKLASLDVLVTDMVMPKLRGTEVAKSLRERFPGLKIIFMSGYADGMLRPEDLDANTMFLAKPLSLSALAKSIRELMDSAKSN
jgi:hypothetical protein